MSILSTYPGENITKVSGHNSLVQSHSQTNVANLVLLVIENKFFKIFLNTCNGKG